MLTTVSQIGGAAGVALLGVVFFGALDTSLTGGATPLASYSGALNAILPWQIACYVAAAALMLLLPRRATASEQP